MNPERQTEIMEAMSGDGIDLSAIIDGDAVDPNEIPKITPQSTKHSAERVQSHKAKMAGKKYDRKRKEGQTTHFSKLDFSASRLRRHFGIGSIAHANRHTGKPHDNAQAIMRRSLTPPERRAFAEKVATAMEGSA